uniref:Protein FAM219A n=1 Tax=Amblyomma triste TaxID=251400 RepID=A0A023G7F8_AMBTT
MEDSGIDSDSKTNSCNGGDRSQQDQPASLKQFDGCEADMNEAEGAADKSQDALPEEQQRSSQDQVASKSRALQLHRRLERHIQQSKKIRQQTRNACIDSQPKKMLLPRSRLPVPNKGQGSTAQPSGDTEPLVTWKSDSEEDFEFQPTSKAAAREITQQLIRDGYDLDLTPDDDDLDLIPPKPLSQRCSCCNPSQTCSVM